ncbi:DUF6470 family protein [Metabacillus halosaccharovorans]|uniref:DUF6470 family protein n=1 Tax=Metabacillus halosaccharovorans TaxID=930124 RepID=UPI000995A870|nr:DUF6470 family protein [Metabacillus halosaccharovorans]
MNIPQIRLESTNAQISMTTRNAISQIHQPKADMSIEQPKADLSVRTTHGKLTIDQSQARADVDLKSVFLRTEEHAQLGKQGLLAGIQRRAQEGEELMKIENGGNPISIQAKRHGHKPTKEFGIGFVPSVGSVKINYQPSVVKTNITPNKPMISVQVNKPVHDYQPGKVDISLAQENNLNIDFETIDIMV